LKSHSAPIRTLKDSSHLYSVQPFDKLTFHDASSNFAKESFEAEADSKESSFIFQHTHNPRCKHFSRLSLSIATATLCEKIQTDCERESHCHCVCVLCAFVTCPQIHLNKLFRRYRSALVCGLMGEKGNRNILAQHASAHAETDTWQQNTMGY
jgi:hypothetical protein